MKTSYIVEETRIVSFEDFDLCYQLLRTPSGKSNVPSVFGIICRATRNGLFAGEYRNTTITANEAAAHQLFHTLVNYAVFPNHIDDIAQDLQSSVFTGGLEAV